MANGKTPRTPRDTPTRGRASRGSLSVVDSGARRPPWAGPFLLAFKRLGNVSAAAAAANTGRSSVYRLRESDPAFAAEWEAALEEAIDSLEREAWRRAVEGVEEPVYSRGEHVDDVRRYSDVLLIHLLKAHLPAKYRERHEVTSSLSMAATQGLVERAVAIVLKNVQDPETLNRIQTEFDELDRRQEAAR